jgi:hypothetical protein
MKHGILYFLYLGRLSWLARILLLPGFYWLTRVPPLYQAKFNPGFAFAIFVDLTLLILSMLPAPSDKYARNMIAKYEKEFDEYIHDTYRGKIRFENIHILKAWQPYRHRGLMNLEIKLDGDVITPMLTFVAALEGKDEVIFERATYLLLGEDRMTRRIWRVKAGDNFQARIEKANENDSRVDLILPAADGRPEEAFVVTENFHLREFIAPLDAIVPQSREIRDFAKGAMLQARNK